MIEFNIIDEADQQFATVLGDRRVTIRLRYNVSTDRWNMDLSIDDEPVLTGRRVVTGIDLLAPFDFGIGAIFAVPEKDGTLPDRNNLPRGIVRLYHATDAEMAEIPQPEVSPLLYSQEPISPPVPYQDWFLFDGQWRIGGVWRDDIPWWAA